MRALMWESFAPGGPIRVGGHHYAERFLRDGWRVAWCVGPLSPVNVIKTNAETRARMRLWRRGGERLHEGGMFAYAPMTLAPFRPYPLFDRPVVQRLTLRLTAPRVKSVLSKAGFEAIDLLWMSTGSPLLALLDDFARGLSIYRMSDDTSAFPATPKSFAAIEAEVCRRADLVLATARVLADRAGALGARRVLYLPNACEAERFLPRARPEPGDLNGMPRPRAIYAGAIDGWFDARLLRDVARRLPAWSFVLLGPARARPESLLDLPNVRLLGPRPYEDLPAYLGAADAGIVPFVVSRLTDAIHPLKVYEYCAAGLPVVATPLRETGAMGAPLRQAATADEFAAALEETRGDGGGARADRLEFARRNTWDRRFAVLRSEIDALLGQRPTRVAGGRA